jgi:hypothetical protein
MSYHRGTTGPKCPRCRGWLAITGPYRHCRRCGWVEYREPES